jgi:hypothetical protein
MRKTSVLFVLAFAATALMVVPVRADHTDPGTPLSPIDGVPPAEILTTGIGTWEFIQNFPANPGTDLKLFAKRQDVLVSTGTLGQADEGHVGQRVIRLTRRKGAIVDPTWRADHGSANCFTENPGGTTGLQHDAAVDLYKNPKLLIDTTDATGRCHDGPRGGLELIDISGIERAAFEPREIHLTRHAGTSHTVTVDATRPWIVYNSNSDFAGRPWIDVLDVRTCRLPWDRPLEEKRDTCRPLVYRIKFQPEWSQQRDWFTGELEPGTEAGCHDITARPGRIYCAGLNATLIFDVTGLTDPVTGDVLGTPLSCPVVDGENTAAKATDCSQTDGATEEAEGWVFLGTHNHPGRDCAPPPEEVKNCNNNLFVPASEGVSVSHEADPDETGNWMFVTDERGGGVVPPGSTCEPGVDNPVGNGGIHVFDISDPANIQYALQPDGTKAVFRGEVVVPAPTFCDVHVIETVPGEQRIISAYYTQGTKIVDYFIDADGRWTFEEVASFVPQGVNANTWAVQHFKIVDNGDGTNTYYFVASDIQRGIDVFSWTGPPNPMGASPRASLGRAAVGFGGVGLGLVPLAAWLATRTWKRRRRV